MHIADPLLDYSGDLMDFLANNFSKTLMAIVAIFIVDLMIEFLLLKRIGNSRKQAKAKVITRNVLICTLIFFLIKIWVDGFVHFLALLGFVAAALTVTQKENILNLTGGLIIMWRQAFSEGDYITISNHSGIIKNLGVFYFTIDEIVPGTINDKNGREVKIPNSYISLNPFTVYRFDHFVLLDKSYYFSFESCLSKLEEATIDIEQTANQFFEKLSDHFTHEEKKEFKKLNQRNRFLPISCQLTLSQGDINGFKLRIFGHCAVSQQLKAYTFFDKSIIDIVKSQKLKLTE